MATTYTVSNTFTTGTIVASQVNANFTDILTALNAFDASNLSSGTVPLARIAGLTTSQFAANVIDTDDTLAADSDTRVASQSASKTFIETQDDAHVGVPGQLHYDGSTVFNTKLTTSNVWQSLDLSAYVGTRRALCFFKITANGNYVVRMGTTETGTVVYHYNYIGSDTVWISSGSDTGGYMTMMTHSNGTLSIVCNSNVPTVTIVLVAYIY